MENTVKQTGGTILVDQKELYDLVRAYQTELRILFVDGVVENEDIAKFFEYVNSFAEIKKLTSAQEIKYEISVNGLVNHSYLPDIEELLSRTAGIISPSQSMQMFLEDERDAFWGYQINENELRKLEGIRYYKDWEDGEVITSGSQ